MRWHLMAVMIPSSLVSSLTDGASTVFVVARQEALAQERVLTLATAANSTRLTMRYASSASAMLFQHNSTGATISTSVGFVNTDWNIMCARHQDSIMALSNNGSTESSNANGADVSSVTQGTIGSNGNGSGDFLTGHIAEIIIYQRSLSAEDIRQVKEYLHHKWGILIQGTLNLEPFSPENTEIPFNVLYDGYDFSTDIIMNDYKVTPTATYYNATTGSNANDGLTLGNATHDLDTIIGYGNISGASYQCNSSAGTYDRNWNWGATPTEDVNIIASGGDVILDSYQHFATLTADGGAYKTTRSAVGGVYDASITDSNGTMERLTEVASVALCQSTSGSWYSDGTEVWMHASDDRDLSSDASDIRIRLSVSPPLLTTDHQLYVENIFMRGFQANTLTISNASNGGGQRFYMNGGEISYCIASNNLSCNGAQEVILHNVACRDAYLDGLNYHIKNNIAPSVYEINCTVTDCGYSGSGSNNGSTMHDGGFVTRVGGIYSGAESRNIHDVDAGTVSLNIGVTTQDSRGASDTTSINFMAGDGDGGQTRMFLINCQSQGSTKDLRVESNSAIYVTPASHLLKGNATVATSGKIEPIKIALK